MTARFAPWQTALTALTTTPSVDYLVGRTDNKEASTTASMEERIAQLEQMMAQLKQN